MRIRFAKLQPHAMLPVRATDGAVGLDVGACLLQPVTLAPFDRALISTGLQVQLPMDYEVQVRPRSGLAYQYGVTVLNSPGTIDPDYLDEIRVLLINLGREDFVVGHGDRIAQLVVAPISRAEPMEVEIVDPIKHRNHQGFGSTGRSMPAA